MGLEAILSDRDSLVLGRSLGSALWLVPPERPLVQAALGGSSDASDIIPFVFCRREGDLVVGRQEAPIKIDCSSLLRGRKGPPPQLRLVVVAAGKALSTEFVLPSSEGGSLYSFDCLFHFPTKESGDAQAAKFQLVLQERGIQAAKEEHVQESCCECACKAATCIICCPFKYILCLPCTLISSCVSLTKDVALAGADEFAELLGKGTNLAVARPSRLSDVVTANSAVHRQFTLRHVRGSGGWLQSQRTAKIHLDITWRAPRNIQEEESSDLIKHKSKRGVGYMPLSARELMQREGMTPAFRVWDEMAQDPLSPRTTGPPPKVNMKAIYGVGLRTEVGAVFRKKARVIHNNNQEKIEVLHELDTAARIAKGVDANISIEGGKVMSLGDGTVPHWSLQHAETFQETCSVSLEEIDGAEHREILADSRFHKILIEHITSAE